MILSSRSRIPHLNSEHFKIKTFIKRITDIEVFSLLITFTLSGYWLTHFDLVSIKNKALNSMLDIDKLKI